MSEVSRRLAAAGYDVPGRVRKWAHGTVDPVTDSRVFRSDVVRWRRVVESFLREHAAHPGIIESKQFLDRLLSAAPLCTRQGEVYVRLAVLYERGIDGHLALRELISGWLALKSCPDIEYPESNVRLFVRLFDLKRTQKDGPSLSGVDLGPNPRGRMRRPSAAVCAQAAALIRPRLSTLLENATQAIRARHGREAREREAFSAEFSKGPTYPRKENAQ